MIPSKRMIKLIELLEVESGELIAHQRMVDSRRRRRNIIICKLSRMGLSTRDIGQVAGISGVAASNIINK